VAGDDVVLDVVDRLEPASGGCAAVVVEGGEVRGVQDESSLRAALGEP
jgi:hypothetical protein